MCHKKVAHLALLMANAIQEKHPTKFWPTISYKGVFRTPKLFSANLDVLLDSCNHCSPIYTVRTRLRMSPCSWELDCIIIHPNTHDQRAIVMSHRRHDHLLYRTWLWTHGLRSGSWWGEEWMKKFGFIGWKPYLQQMVMGCMTKPCGLI